MIRCHVKYSQIRHNVGQQNSLIKYNSHLNFTTIIFVELSKQTRVVPTHPEPISRGRCTGTGSNLIPSNSRHEGSPCKRLPVVVPQSSGFSRVPSGHDLNYRTPRRASSLSGSRGRTGSHIRRYHAQYCTFDFRLFDQVSDITGCKGTVSLYLFVVVYFEKFNYEAQNSESCK